MLNVNTRYKKKFFPCSYFVCLIHMKPFHETWVGINIERGGLEISDSISCCSVGKQIHSLIKTAQDL